MSSELAAEIGGDCRRLSPHREAEDVGHAVAEQNLPRPLAALRARERERMKEGKEGPGLRGVEGVEGYFSTVWRIFLPFLSARP